MWDLTNTKNYNENYIRNFSTGSLSGEGGMGYTKKIFDFTQWKKDDDNVCKTIGVLEINENKNSINMNNAVTSCYDRTADDVLQDYYENIKRMDKNLYNYLKI